MRRDAAVVPIGHGGGQERGIRSGTLNVAGLVGFATALEHAVGAVGIDAARLSRLRADLIGAIQAEVPDVVLSGTRADGAIDGGPSRLPGNVHLRFPGCDGESLLMLLDTAGVECSLGSACTAGVARVSHVLLAMGVPERDARAGAPVLVGAQFDRRRRGRGGRRDRPGSRSRQGRRRGGRPGRGQAGELIMRVVAAMSGGVDSAVAAALAVEAGHEVVGVHMALSRQPGTLRTGSRGCCTVEDAFDARRVSDLLGIPFYVWDFSEDFAETVVADFLAEYSAGRTPNPCLRCNEKIKFAALLDRAIALGFDAVATGHYARIVDGALLRSVDAAKDQSYVLAVLTPDQVRHSMFPLGGMTKDVVRAEAARRGFAVAAKPDSYDICFIPEGDTHGYLVDKLGARAGSVIDAATATCSERTTGTSPTPSASARG